MEMPDKTNKRLVVYDQKDPEKYYSLDISKAQVWELEPEHSDWDPIDCFPRQTTERTLYRLPGNHWVLVEETSHFEAGSLGPHTGQGLTDAQAAEQLVLSGHTPPADVAHHVQDKLLPPPVQSVAKETRKTSGDERDAEREFRELSEAMFGLPAVKKFGPMRDPYSGDETTLFQYPYNRWILHTSPSYAAAGQRHTALTPPEAVTWFLNNGLEVPQDLYDLLPAPTEQHSAAPVLADTSEKIDSYQEPPNGQNYGPVVDEWGNRTTLTYYSPCYWILHGRYSGENWRKSLTFAEAAEWLLDNDLVMPPILTPYLPLSSERSAPETEPQKERIPPPPEPKQPPAHGASEECESDAQKYVSENRHRVGTANPRGHQAPVVPDKYGEPVMVKGNPKKLSTLAAYKLVKALVEAGDRGLSKGQLEPISTDYWRILKGLKDSDPDWNAVIHFPGRPHGRYRIG